VGRKKAYPKFVAPEYASIKINSKFRNVKPRHRNLLYFPLASVLQADSRQLQDSCSQAIRVWKVMEQIYSWEPDSCSAGQEFSLISGVHLPTHVGASNYSLIFKLSEQNFVSISHTSTQRHTRVCIVPIL